MKNLIFLLLFLAIANAVPVCPPYPYHDFVWASAYSAPSRPLDTLLDNCNSLGLDNAQLCSVVNDSRLTDAQKKQLILDDFVKGSGTPPFNESENWNSNLQFTKYPPDGTQTRSSSYIKDAWVRIVSLSPAVIDSTGNRTYINSTGQLRMAKDFTFVVPKETFTGDCRTEYAVCGYNYALSAYGNSQPLPKISETVAAYTLSSPAYGAQNNFTVSLTIHTQYIINHYHPVTHCKGKICITTCEFYASESRTDSLIVPDSKTAYYYGSMANQTAFVDSYKDNLSDVWLSITANADFNNIGFSIGNSFLKLQGKQYQLEPDLAPYNVLTPISLPAPGNLQIKGLSVLSRDNWTISGLHGEKLHILAPANSLNCTVEINTHFESALFSNACRYNATQQPTLNLTIANATNASFVAFARFYDNSTGEPLSGKNLTFSYADEAVRTSTGSSGSAYVIFPRVPQSSLVSVVFLTDFETKSAKAYAVVPAPVPDILSSIWQLAFLAFAVWIAYRMARGWFA